VAAGAVHLATGFAVGSHARTVPGGFVAGFVSHAVFDVIPHHDYHKAPAALADLAGGLAVLALMIRRHRRAGRLGPSLAGAVGAAVPDVENAMWWLGVIPGEARRYPTHGGPLRQRDASYRFTALYYALAVAVAWMAISRRPS
jgi:hypothetical protein